MKLLTSCSGDIIVDKEIENSKHKIEVRFYKKSLEVERFSLYFPYGKCHKFKTNKETLNFIDSKLKNADLERYDIVCIIVWNGYSRSERYIKQSNNVSDEKQIDKEYILDLFNDYKKLI